MPASRVLGATVGIGAAALLAVGGVAAANAATPAPAPHWHVAKSVSSGVTGDFTAVVATGKTTGWAFNGNPISAPTSAVTAWEWKGSTWTREAFPVKADEEVIAADATSPSDVWAFTQLLGASGGSRVLHYNGHAWSVVKTFADPIGGASVVSGNDVWVFGQPGITEQLGAWHYNGSTWTRVSKNADGGSALAANDVWAFSGTSVEHWNGTTWTSTNVAKLLPAKSQLNDPLVTGVYALSANCVYAIGNGNLEDDGGPTAVLHYNGSTWTRVAEGNFGYGTSPSQQISPDGSGGLWLPMPGYDGQPSYLAHYAAGKLTKATLPVAAAGIDVESVARIPGTTEQLAGGFTHAKNNLGSDVTAVILQYS